MQRKLFKAGNSLVVTIPKQILKDLGVGQGDEFNLEYDKESRKIILSPVTPKGIEEKITSEMMQWVEEFSDEYADTLEKLAE